MTKLVQIVPNLPPNLNGVGDFALLLAAELRDKHGIETSFLVANPDWKGADQVHGFKAARMDRERFEIPFADEDAAAVFLQYVGYGYSHRGAPMWLVRWARSLRQSFPSTRFLTFFHELYAVGPPWKSSFWLCPVQWIVCCLLARLSAARFSNRFDSAIILRRMALGRNSDQTIVMPVISNFGEPESVTPLSQRKPQLAVYGGVSRLPEDKAFAAAKLRELCTNLGIERVVSFGKTPLESFSPDYPIENRGVLPAAEVSALLLESLAGYIDYPEYCLAKSGIFAAYSAHGLLPVILRKISGNTDGLQSGRNMAIADGPLPSGAHERQAIATAARLWYQGHSLSRLAESVRQALQPQA